MSAHQALMVSTIREGTNLGSESADSSSFGSTRADASAAIVFGSNGSVTFSQTGGSISNTAPATNWNTNGGTYLSYELIYVDSGFEPDISDAGVSYANGSALASSTLYGENRYLVSNNISVYATASALLNEYNNTSAQIEVKVSIWDAASQGTRKAYGTYTALAAANIF